MRLQIVLVAVIVVGCQAPPGESTLSQNSVNVPASFDFGALPIDMLSPVHTVRIAPGPLNQSDTIKQIAASCPDFVVNAPGLPADVYRICEIVTCGTKCPNVICQTTELQDYTFDTYFKPTVAGPVSCVVTVTESDNNNDTTNQRTITLTGNGTAPPVRVDVEPAAVAFGDVRRTTDSTQAQVVVTSVGAMPLTVSSVTVSAGFAIVSGPTGSFQLAPNQSQAYPIICHPLAVGAMTGQLTVTSDDPSQRTVAVPLSCKGIDSNLEITPSPATLPTTRVGEPVDSTIVLRNSGTASMTLQSVSLTGTGITMVSGPSPGTVLQPSGAASVAVHFGAGDKGDASATLVATYDAGQTRSAQVSGRALATSMALTPDGDIDFGPVCVGQKRTQGFTLIANDQGGFSLTSISEPGAPFLLSAPNMPIKVLGGGASQATFQIAAAPTDEGPATGGVLVHTDIPGRGDRRLSLGVLGLLAGVAATPRELDLGSNPVNTTTLGQEVHLSNCTGAPVAFSHARIEGDDALDFAIVQQPGAPTIMPNGVASWLIVLQAHTVGVKQATFRVDHDGGTASIDLQGEGLGDAGKPDHRGSYYACGIGRPQALWPIALAIAVVVLRRRRRR